MLTVYIVDKLNSTEGADIKLSKMLLDCLTRQGIKDFAWFKNPKARVGNGSWVPASDPRGVPYNDTSCLYDTNAQHEKVVKEKYCWAVLDFEQQVLGQIDRSLDEIRSHYGKGKEKMKKITADHYHLDLLINKLERLKNKVLAELTTLELLKVEVQVRVEGTHDSQACPYKRRKVLEECQCWLSKLEQTLQNPEEDLPRARGAKARTAKRGKKRKIPVATSSPPTVEPEPEAEVEVEEEDGESVPCEKMVAVIQRAYQKLVEDGTLKARQRQSELSGLPSMVQSKLIFDKLDCLRKLMEKKEAVENRRDQLANEVHELCEKSKNSIEQNLLALKHKLFADLDNIIVDDDLAVLD